MRPILRCIPLLMALGLLLACEVLAAGAQEANRGTMGDVVIEQLGGFVGGGTPLGHLRMEGRMAWSALSEADQRRLDALFAERKPVNANLRYRLTRNGPNGPETVEAPAEAVPKRLIESIKTTIE
jgi:hypothetical protein